MNLAKLTQPRSINTIPRPRLFRALNQAAKKPVTWIWAPPGAGKTTLVSSCLTSQKSRALWFQVDAGDNDIATFFYYLGLAAPKRKRPMPLFTPEYRAGLAVFTRNFCRELFGRYQTAFTLVFDNYQEIDLGSELHEALGQALSEVPLGARVIFISRADAPAPFAPIRARQCMQMIEAEEIKFTRSEVSALVKRLAPGRWPKQAIDQLHESAHGWAAGLVLLLDELRSEGATRNVSQNQSSQVLFDYFAGEIFKRRDPRRPAPDILPTSGPSFGG